MAVSIPVTAQAPAQASAAVVATDIPARLDRLRWGVQMARRAWVRPEDVLNTRQVADFRSRLRRHRTR